jgi:hypothetical protein
MNFMERKLHKRIRENLINRNEINEDIRLINGSLTDYVSPVGNIYKDYGNDLFFKKKTQINKNRLALADFWYIIRILHTYYKKIF